MHLRYHLLHFAFFIFLFIPCLLHAENSHTDTSRHLWNQYAAYKEPLIHNRFFKHSDLNPLVLQHAAAPIFTHTVAGQSAQGRDIHHLVLGTGKIKILLWSQMHGDESTATMALFDLFNFFLANDENNELRQFLLNNLELHFVPMLNPDGAQVWQRRNAQDIDINRDARAQQTPEGQILMNLVKTIQPAFGFNLHDQSVYYTAGPTQHTATISFLSPAYNYEKEMNDVRTKATQVIVAMNKTLQQHIPGKVARYNDDFEPRAFGDNVQRMGVSTILIESGGYPNDPEKQHIRKLNFMALLTAFESIAKGSYTNEDIRQYETIPQNSRNLYDLVIRNVNMEKAGQKFTTNLAINRSQIKSKDFRSMSYRGVIEEVGDMEKVFGYDELEAAGLSLHPGKTKILTKKEWLSLNPIEEMALVKEGFLYIKWSDEKVPTGVLKNRLLNITNEEKNEKETGLGEPANFLLTKNGVAVYAVINGYLVDLSKTATIPNAWGY